MGEVRTADGGSTMSGCRKASRRNLADTEIMRHARNWERPSDHVPVIVNLDV